MKRQTAWNKLKDEMGNKRNRNDRKTNKKGSAPHEIIVQRLASEADNKQTYKPIRPREFVQFPFEDLSLANLKKACAQHFNIPAPQCDILVSNKGPSCSNISQIPHRKDKVYLVRFVLQDEQPDADSNSDPESSESRDGENLSLPGSSGTIVKVTANKKSSKDEPKSTFPASLSIEALLKAGKLIKPKPQNKVTLILESFDISSQKWLGGTEEELAVDLEKFSSGGFRDAFHAASSQNGKKWVVKTYNAKTKKTIEDTAKTTIENHCRKQVQMHEVSRHLAETFESKAPPAFGKCFKYNKCFYTVYNGEPSTIEEFVPGTFLKLINNDGSCLDPPEESSRDLYAKAQCLVHFSYASTKEKLMLLDIQGSGYTLYDPEISSVELTDVDSDEINFCCGNCSTYGMETFLKSHICNEFCKLMDLSNKMMST